MPTPARFFPAPVPAEVAAEAGCGDAPTCFCDIAGAPGSRRTSPPSWSVISSSGDDTGLCRRAWRSCRITDAIWLSLEMFPPKKITPAAWPARICSSNEDGTCSPEYEKITRCPASCRDVSVAAHAVWVQTSTVGVRAADRLSDVRFRPPRVSGPFR